MAAALKSSLCPKGFWMTEKDAAKHLNINTRVMKLFKKYACPTNMHFEHGNKVAAPMPYHQFLFVFISPEGTKSNYGNITLLKWCRMCDYFSNNMNTPDDAGNMHLHDYFKEYMNEDATPANIAAAFEAGFLKRPSQLISSAPIQVVTPPKPKSTNNTNNKTNNNKTKPSSKVNQQRLEKGGSETVDDLIPSEERLTGVLANRLQERKVQIKR